jgi:ABC-type branched-subunit amino acid transport system ATPase component
MTALLNLKNLNAFYGAAHILHDLNLHVNQG